MKIEKLWTIYLSEEEVRIAIAETYKKQSANWSYDQRIYDKICNNYLSVEFQDDDSCALCVSIDGVMELEESENKRKPYKQPGLKINLPIGKAKITLWDSEI